MRVSPSPSFIKVADYLIPYFPPTRDCQQLIGQGFVHHSFASAGCMVPNKYEVSEWMNKRMNVFATRTHRSDEEVG